MGAPSKAKAVIAGVVGTIILLLSIGLWWTYSSLQDAELTIAAQKVTIDSYDESRKTKEKSDKITEDTGTEISNKKESRENERNQINDAVTGEVDKIRKEYQVKEREAQNDRERLEAIQKDRADKISRVRLEASWKAFCASSVDVKACLDKAKEE